MSEIHKVECFIRWWDIIMCPHWLIPSIIEQRLREAGFQIRPPQRVIVNNEDLKERILPPVEWWDDTNGRHFVQMYETWQGVGLCHTRKKNLQQN